MKQAHIHEVLIDMQDGNKSFADKKEFVEHVVKTFGKDCKFHSCSAESMDANDAYDFLIRRNKIVADEQNKITLHPSMTMCDGHKHEHDHDHDHH